MNSALSPYGMTPMRTGCAACATLIVIAASIAASIACFRSFINRLLGLLLSTASLLLARYIEQNGADDNHAFYDLLVIGRHAQQIQAVVDHADQQRADHRAAQRTRAARQARTADHDRGDRVELVRETRLRQCRSRARGEHDAGKSGQQTAYHVHRENDLAG